MKNHGKIDPMKLKPETRHAMIQLGVALMREPGVHKAQITYDGGPDEPPTVHLIVDPAPQTMWPDYWFGE